MVLNVGVTGMKKYMYICLVVVVLLIIGKRLGKTDIVSELHGQWKVTEFLACKQYGVSYSYYDHFLGRSITITPEQIITSLNYWPEKIEYSHMTYDDYEVESIDAYQYGAQERMNEPWFEILKNQSLKEVTFLDTPANYRTFYITETGEVICSYLSNFYYMEPYVETVTNLRQEQIYGQWKVERLISYQDGWKGNSKVYLETELSFENIDICEEEAGANFYPEKYYGKCLLISENSISLWEEETVIEEHGVLGYDMQMHNKNYYQEQNGIYDELGIANEEIQVFSGNLSGGVEDMLLNGDFVVVDDEKIITKIYQGWYLLVKEY